MSLGSHLARILRNLASAVSDIGLLCLCCQFDHGSSEVGFRPGLHLRLQRWDRSLQDMCHMRLVERACISPTSVA